MYNTQIMDTFQHWEMRNILIILSILRSCYPCVLSPSFRQAPLQHIQHIQLSVIRRVSHYWLYVGVLRISHRKIPFTLMWTFLPFHFSDAIVLLFRSYVWYSKPKCLRPVLPDLVVLLENQIFWGLEGIFVDTLAQGYLRFFF